MKEIHHTHAVATGSMLIPIIDPGKKLAMYGIRLVSRSGGKGYIRVQSYSKAISLVSNTSCCWRLGATLYG